MMEKCISKSDILKRARDMVQVEHQPSKHMSSSSKFFAIMDKI
jgi:hypothetical protein